MPHGACTVLSGRPALPADFSSSSINRSAAVNIDKRRNQLGEVARRPLYLVDQLQESRHATKVSVCADMRMAAQRKAMR